MGRMPESEKQSPMGKGGVETKSRVKKRATGRARERRGRQRGVASRVCFEENREGGSRGHDTEGVVAESRVPQSTADREQLRGVRSGEQKGERKKMRGKKRGRQKEGGDGGHSVFRPCRPPIQDGDHVPVRVPGEICKH